MKKLLTFALALCMTLSLAACGDTKVVLETQTVNGISIDVPGDFSEFTEQAGGMMATDENKTGVITVSAPADAGGISPADFDQDAFVEQMLGAPEGIEITSFDNIVF